MNESNLKSENLNGEYKVTFNEIKDGEYNIDVDDSAGKSDRLFKLILGVLVAILLILFIGILSFEYSKQTSKDNEENVKEIQDLKQSYTELQKKVDELIKKQELVKKQLSNDTTKKKAEDVQEEQSSGEFYGIKKVNVSKDNVKMPSTPKVDQKIPATPKVDQKIPAIPKVDQKIPEVPTVK